MSDLFVREDISKPENRINLTMFHLLMIDDFRDWFYLKLNLDPSSVIYPVTNSGGNRPDMIIKNDSKIIGCIEVELGSENVSQTLSYSNIYEKVITICGLPRHNSDLSLEEIKDHLNVLDTSGLNPQQKLSIKYLVKLIETYIYGFETNTRTQISTKVSEHAFFKIIIESLSDIIANNISKIYPGEIVVDTVKDEGFSLKVYSKLSKNNKVALISRSGGRDTVIFQSAQKYRNYLPNKQEAVIRWIEFVENDLNFNLESLGINNRISIPIRKFDEEKIQKMIGLIRKLA